MLRDVIGPTMRGNGLKGSAPTWRRTNDQGDVAIVNLQSSPWNSAESVRCAVNLAAVPEPWRDWYHSQMAKPPKNINESFGMFRTCLRDENLLSRGDRWWTIEAAEDAAVAGDEITRLLSDHALPQLLALLDRSTMLAAVRADQLGDITKSPVYTARCEAALLTDEGPSASLDDALARARHGTDPDNETALAFEAWARARAARV